MAGFVRIKRVMGHYYAYAVANSWTEKGPRQKVSKYLGKVLRPEKAKSESLREFLKNPIDPYLDNSSYDTIIYDLIRLELSNHNMKSELYKISPEENSFKTLGGKDIVFRINEGFLCNFTVEKLLKYDSENDYSGFLLADLLTAAGLKVEKDVFVALYGKKMPKSTPKSLDFYY